MSVASADTRTPRNCLWIDTRFIVFCHDIVGMAPGEHWFTGPYKFSDLEGSFSLQVTKRELNIVMVSMVRERLPPDPGYFVRFTFTAVTVEEAPKQADMYAGQDHASVFYTTEAFLRAQLLHGAPPSFGGWLFKVNVRVFEYFNPEDNFRHDYYKKLCAVVIAKYNLTDRQVRDMDYLLNPEPMRDLVSGRQCGVFGCLKISIAARSAVHSTEIVQLYDSITRGSADPPTEELKKMLNFVAHSVPVPMSYADMVSGYQLAYQHGLSYLKVIFRWLVMHYLDDLNLLIDVIKAADEMHDTVIFNMAADVFHANMLDVVSNPRWLVALIRTPKLVYCAMHSVRMRVLIRGMPSAQRNRDRALQQGSD